MLFPSLTVGGSSALQEKKNPYKFFFPLLDSTNLHENRACTTTRQQLRPHASSYSRTAKCLSAQPPTVACKMEAQSGYAHIAHTFLHVRRPICMPSRWFVDKIFYIGAQKEAY